MSEDDVAWAWYEQVNVHHISKARDSQAMEMESVFPDLFSWIYLNIKPHIIGHWVEYSSDNTMIHTTAWNIDNISISSNQNH